MAFFLFLQYIVCVMKKAKTQKERNPMAAALRAPCFRKRVIRSKKGKASYTRKKGYNTDVG